MTEADMSLIPKTERFSLYRTLVGELRSCMLHGAAKKKKSQEHAGMLLMTTGVQETVLINR